MTIYLRIAAQGVKVLVKDFSEALRFNNLLFVLSLKTLYICIFAGPPDI